MTALQRYLAEVRKRAEKATDGPWRHSVTVRTQRDLVDAYGGKRDVTGTRAKTRHADADFIAAARTDVPRLLEIVRVLEGALAESRNEAAKRALRRADEIAEAKL